jgi:hypothetical protein
MSVKMHGVIEYHGWFCQSVGIGLVAPAWLPDWVPGFCRATDIWKQFVSTAEALEGRRALMATFEEHGLVKGLTIDIHIEPEE